MMEDVEVGSVLWVRCSLTLQRWEVSLAGHDASDRFSVWA